MDIYRVFKGKVWQYVQAVFFALVVIFCLSSTVYAAEDVSTLPHVAKWVNGLAVSDSGVYLSDTWAVDDTGVSAKKYVLVDQGSEEAMRIENYPNDIADGDTEPCEKHSVVASLDLVDSVSGDAFITLENDAAEYSVSFSEGAGYKADLELYPGVYEVTDVEVAGDLSSTYRVSNYHQIDVSSDLTISLEVTNADMAAGGEEGANADNGEDDASGSEGSSATSEDDNELLGDTIKLFVVVTVLFAIYAVIKYKRAKSEEIKQ